MYLNNGEVMNPGGLRFADEAVRHKALDVIGDLFLAGKPVLGAFVLDRPGHTANNALLRKINEAR
jgi:UDP-3-O-[3-hydroxymyristoyl] N-acetylglucosamine deacetylase